MNPSPAVLLAILFWAGICAADQRALGGRQFHQPIVAAAAAGLLLHAPERALFVGIWLQLIWIAPLPIGGVVLPDTGSAAVAAALVAATIPGWQGLGIAVVVGLMIGAVSIPWERALRAANERRESRTLDRDRGPDTPASPCGRDLGRHLLLGVAGPFVRGALCAGAALALALLLAPILRSRSVGSSAIGEASIERALWGGAACFGLAGLFLGVRPEKGRGGVAWVLGGVLLGLAGGLLLRGGRG